MFSIHIQSNPIALAGDDPLMAQEQRCGAVVRFVGRVRNDPHGATALSHLVLEHFPGVTENEIERIIAQARARWDLQRVQVIHRTGHIAVGEAIVMVETASAHRKDAYEANHFVMDYLKTQAPFWKKECFVDDSEHWVEAKDSDQVAQQRWQQTSARRRIGALILAGGKGRRMGHCNKGLQSFRGLPLVQHVIRTLQPQVDYLAISANHDLPAYRAFGLPVFQDDAAWGGMGPLAGLVSAIPQFPPDLDAIVIAPCDTPLLPDNLVARLETALFTPSAAPAAVATTADSMHPSLTLFRPALLLGLLHYLHSTPQDQMDLSLRGWLQRSGCSEVFFDDAQAFANINDLPTLQQLQCTTEIPATTTPAHVSPKTA